MMKKLLLLSSVLFAFHFGAKAQMGVSTPTVIQDTLNYFINKEHFKVGTTMQGVAPTFAFYKAPTGNATNSFTYVTHCGSMFKNSDTNLIVKGLEGWAARSPKCVNASVNVMLYLCNVVNGLPVLPAVDSVMGHVSNGYDTQTLFTVPQLISGDFLTPKRVKGNFAVLIRNYSSVTGDTVRFYRTSTLTPGSNLLTGPNNSYYKSGEGLGVVRKSGQFLLTANYSAVPGFGVGTDYEFCVAPRVQFTLTVSQAKPSGADSSCVFTGLTFTNTSSPEFNNKQFNLHEFYRQNKPFQYQPTSGGGFQPDSVMSWNFGDDPRLDTLPHVWGRVQDLYLPVLQNQVLKTFDTISSPGYFTATQKAHYRKMTTCASSAVTGVETFTLISADCGNYFVGVPQIKGLDNVSVFPNPSVNGKVNITGLQGKNTIVAYNILGQAILSETTDKDKITVDLLKQPAGTYTIKIASSTGGSKVVKVIHNND